MSALHHFLLHSPNHIHNSSLVTATCGPGSFKIISRTGKQEKSVDAHSGACIALRWSYDGE